MSKTYYFNLILNSKETNGVRCRNYESFGRKLDDARRDLIHQLLETSFDSTTYTVKMEEEFERVNNLTEKELFNLKNYYYEAEGLELEAEEDLVGYSYYWYLDPQDFKKIIGRKMKDVSYKSKLEIAISELAPGYYHDLIIKRVY